MDLVGGCVHHITETRKPIGWIREERFVAFR
jgi:hypothetical protein